MSCERGLGCCQVRVSTCCGCGHCWKAFLELSVFVWYVIVKNGSECVGISRFSLDGAFLLMFFKLCKFVHHWFAGWHFCGGGLECWMSSPRVTLLEVSVVCGIWFWHFLRLRVQGCCAHIFF